VEDSYLTCTVVLADVTGNILLVGISQV